MSFNLVHAAVGDRIHPEVMESIIGRVPEGKEMIVPGFEVCVLPDITKLDPKVLQILSSGRTDEELAAFLPTTLRPNPNGVARGIAWGITEEEDALLANWDIEGPWSERYEFNVVAGNQLRMASAFILKGEGFVPLKQHLSGEVRDYINDRDLQIRIAEEARTDFLGEDQVTENGSLGIRLYA